MDEHDPDVRCDCCVWWQSADGISGSCDGGMLVTNRLDADGRSAPHCPKYLGIPERVAGLTP